MRQAEVTRNTLETRICLKMNLDGTGKISLDTGVPFLDHMLAQSAHIELVKTVRHGSLAGYHHPACFANHFRVIGYCYGCIRGYVLQRLGHGTEISHAIVDDCDISHARNEEGGEKLEGAFGGGDGAGSARIEFHRHAQCATERLEHGFCLMMRVAAGEIIDVQRYHGVIDEALEKLIDQVDVEFTNAGAPEFDVEFHPRSSREVHDNAR